jgi:PIN domain nuclease of toxin-antitoxin system
MHGKRRRMSGVTWVLDTSALLAVLQREPGAELVRSVLRAALISSVNFAEAASTMVFRGSSINVAESALFGYGVPVIAFTADHAVEAARLRPLTAKQGLSLGDRACLALASLQGLPVMTADRSWGTVDVGVQIEVIR